MRGGTGTHLERMRGEIRPDALRIAPREATARFPDANHIHHD